MSALGAAWRSLRDESLASAWERAADRLADLRHERSFVPVTLELFNARCPVLNLVPFPLRRLWGGTALQMTARLDVEARQRTTAVAMPAREGGWRIEWRDGADRRSCRLDTPWIPQAEPLESDGFEETLQRLADLAGSSLVHFETAARIPLRSLLRLRERGIRWMLSLQDFALLSAWPQRVEEAGGKIVAPADAAERLEAAAEVLAQAAAVVFPSPYLRDSYLRLFPPASPRREIVIPPALALPPSSPPRLGPVRHVAFVGALQRHKGAHLLPEIAARLARAGRGRPERFSVFGAGDPEIARALGERDDLTLHGWYRAGSLPERLRRERVDLALLLSVTPESHGLALDECLSAGVPALAFAQGALAQRIDAMRCGLTVPLAGGVEAVAAALSGIIASGQPLDVSPQLWRVGHPDQLAAAHLELYESLLESVPVHSPALRPEL